MGIASSKNNSESLNWDKINTESMSATVPNLNTINKDAQKLVSNLNIDNNIDLENTESENENIFTWIRKLDESKTGDKIENTNVEQNESDGFSDTSPFISSDMYKYLMNNNNSSETSAQVENQVGGAKDSSTSSTSSSEKKKSSKRKYTESSEVLSGGNLSYISSSAHTEHNSSEEYEKTSVSVSESVNNNILTTSVNTSDINLISED